MALKTSVRTDALTKVSDQNRKLAQHLQTAWIAAKIHTIERIERVNPSGAKKGWKIQFE